MANERAMQRTVTGTVVSDTMDKTITVREERLVKHPLYGKYVRRSTSYKAHDERNEAEAGDASRSFPRARSARPSTGACCASSSAPVSAMRPRPRP